MAIGDRVRIGFGSGIEVNYEGNVAVYDLRRDHNGAVVFDSFGYATPMLIGGIKSGSTGVVIDQPTKADRRLLKGLQETATSLGTEPVMLIPVTCSAYGDRPGWVAAEHVRIIG